MRREIDLLGEGDVPADALYGIHTARAIVNFPLSGHCVHPALIEAFGQVKLAAARTNRALGAWKGDKAKGDAIEQACIEMAKGLLNEHVVVDALQGGAGTSTNMNVNEVLANRALQILGDAPGTYTRVSPVEDINLHQSTNDAYPTALRLAAIMQLKKLDASLTKLVEAFQAKEKQFADVLKIGRTQLQDAVPVTLGREMSAYAEAFGRDRWRLYKSEERLRVVNMGGTAIGTGITAPRAYIFQVADTLREITGIGFARAENLVDATQNEDVFAEVSGLLKTCAANMIKCATDMRLIGSGPEAGIGEVRLPPRQAGSSIMPGKVNPVIPEAMTQAAVRMIGYDQEITWCVGAGNFELNAFAPLIADSLLNGIDLLTNAAKMFRENCLEGLEANVERCRKFIEGSTALATALVPEIGYSKASALAKRAKAEGKSLRQVVLEQGAMTEDRFNELTTPEALMRLGSDDEAPTSEEGEQT
jgi:aspartate ammonia-lyase